MLDVVARGEVSLDAVVAELLPGVLRDGLPVTVRMLLDHTSGIINEGDDGDLVADIAKLTDPVLKDEANAVAGTLAAGDSAIASDRLLVALAETNPRYFRRVPGTNTATSTTSWQPWCWSGSPKNRWRCCCASGSSNPRAATHSDRPR